MKDKKIVSLIMFATILVIPTTTTNAYYGYYPYILEVDLNWIGCKGQLQTGIIEIIIDSPGMNHVELSWNVPYQTWQRVTPFCIGMNFDFITGYLIDTSNGHVSSLTPPVSPNHGIADEYLTSNGICCWTIHSGDYITTQFTIWYGLMPPFISLKSSGNSGTVGQGHG